MEIYESELREEDLNKVKAELQEKKGELERRKNKYYNKDFFETVAVCLCFAIGLVLIFASAFNLSKESEDLRRANELLKQEEKIICQDSNIVIKSYYKVSRKNDYDLILHLRILNLTDKTITSASIINNKTGEKNSNIKIDPYEYIEIEFGNNIQYSDDLDIGIIDVNYE